MAALPYRQLYIAGQWTCPANTSRIDVIDPSTEDVKGSIPAGSPADVDAAVNAARAALPEWSKTAPSQRAALLRAIAAEVLSRKETLAHLESTDMGKPLDESRWDIDDVAGCFEFFAGLADDMQCNPSLGVDTGMPEFKCSVKRQPMGVVALITPWNYPLLMATWKLAPALAAGCSVVLKPSEMASITCLELGDICTAVGMPPGVVNIVTGLGTVAGAALAAHPGVDKVAFTGSVKTGRLVAAAAAANLKPCSLELGGKSALIVFEDTDIDNAVEWAMFGCFWTNGQICSATSRLLVQSSIAQEFYTKLKQRAERIHLCPPLTAGCRLGPVVSKTQHDKIMSFIQSAKDEGANLLTGGRRPTHDSANRPLPAGYYVQPTVFTEVQPNMKIWTEEVFGPVLAAATFETEEEAIKAANDSRFGLAAAVISDDLARCERVANQLDVGIVWVNCSQPAFCQAPWGGRKESGYGRDLGKWGLESFLSVKQVTEYVSRDRWDWYPASQTSRL